MTEDTIAHVEEKELEQDPEKETKVKDPEFRLLSPDLLDPSPLNKIYYVNEKEDAELMNSIEENGQQQPCTVCPTGNGRYEINSGHRRTRIIQKLKEKHPNLMVRCLVTEYEDDLAKKIAFLESNASRIKLWSDKYNEVNLYIEVEAEKADKRKKARLKQNIHDDADGVSGNERKGRSLDIAAERVNISGSTARRLCEVGDLASKKEDKFGIFLMKCVNNNDCTVTDGYNAVKIRQYELDKSDPYAKVLVNEMISGNLKVEDACADWQTYINPPGDDDRDPKRTPVAPPGRYNVLLCNDLMSHRDIMDLSIEAYTAPSAALFILSKPGNIANSLNVCSGGDSLTELYALLKSLIKSRLGSISLCHISILYSA
jgi:ParB/RepB/Spo0J family partition protein